MDARDAIRQLRFQLERYTNLHSAGCVEVDEASTLLKDAKATITESFEAEKRVAPAPIDFELVSTTANGANNIYEMRLPLLRSPGTTLVLQIHTPCAQDARMSSPMFKLRLVGKDIANGQSTFIISELREFDLLATLLHGHARLERVEYFLPLIKKVVK